MKKTLLPTALRVAFTLIVSASILPATDFYWAPDGANPSNGGTGTWDTSSNAWRQGSTTGTLTAWPNVNPSTDVAFLRQTGTITIADDTTIYVNGIDLNVNSVAYTIQGNVGGNAVLAFNGTNPFILGANSSRITFSLLTVDVGSTGVSISQSAANPYRFETGSRIVGSGDIRFSNRTFGARLESNVAQEDFEGGFQVFNTGRREAVLYANAVGSLGQGESSVSGQSRIIYNWGSQVPVGGVVSGVRAYDAGLIDLAGTYTDSVDRFILDRGGVLRGSSAQLGAITRVAGFSSIPSGPEVLLAPGSVVASTTNSTSASVAGLANNAAIYFGLGTTFNNAGFSITLGEGTPWVGIANDSQAANNLNANDGTASLQRQLSDGTITINNTNNSFPEVSFLAQGRGNAAYLAESLWTNLSHNGVVLGNNTTGPTWALGAGSDKVTARVAGGELVLNQASLANEVIGDFAVSYAAALISARTNAIAGRDVSLEGGLLALFPGRVGSATNNASDSVDTLTVGDGLSRISVVRVSAGTPVALTIAEVDRPGRGIVEVTTNNNSLGVDERVIITENLTRGNIIDPFILGNGDGRSGPNNNDALVGQFLVNGSNGLETLATYDTTYAAGNVVEVSTANTNNEINADVYADSIRMNGGITGSGTLHLGRLAGDIQAERAAILTNAGGNANLTIAPNINAGSSELIVFGNNRENQGDTFNGSITAGALTKTGTRLLILNNANNAIADEVTIWQGTLRMGTSRFNAEGDVAVTIGQLGALDITNHAGSALQIGSLNGFGGVSIASGKTLEITGGSQSSEFSGVISGAGSLIQSGSGTQVLSGENSYTGGTTVSGGVLAVNGSILGVTTVSGSGTLAGTGSVGTLIVNSGGVLAPGNSPGILTVGDTTFNPLGVLQLELLTDGTGSAGTDWDQLSVAGTLDLSNLADSDGQRFIIALQTLSDGTTAGPIAVWDPLESHTWTSVITSITLTAFAPEKFDIDTSDFANTINGSFSLVQNGSNIDLVYTAIPEPGTWALLMGLATIGLVAWRRRASLFRG